MEIIRKIKTLIFLSFSLTTLAMEDVSSETMQESALSITEQLFENSPKLNLNALDENIKIVILLKDLFVLNQEVKCKTLEEDLNSILIHHQDQLKELLKVANFFQIKNVATLCRNAKKP